MSEDELRLENVHDGPAGEFAAAGRRWLGRRGMRLTLHPHTGGWVEHMRQAPQTDGLNPTFDPAHNPISAGDAFWLAVRDEGDEVAGCVAARLLVTPDFVGMIRSLRLWYDPVPDALAVPDPPALTGGAVPDRPALTGDLGISGRVGHFGGLWIHPAHRVGTVSRLLVHFLVRAARLAALDRFGSAWETSVSFHRLASRPAFRAALGFEHVLPCHDGYFPPTGRVENVHLNYSAPGHILRIVARTTEALRADDCARSAT
ncbi:hypothetical protein [Planotetraspora kaengkrachanensis]|uniref:Uncharacterized protein n=1 Tax=Planotetraspora kaengkrachanensis TaxID=575193 RepID=A0A8J3PZT7_9ACTN|nr:hypothetical protein [Planotetraspora kaengkrachanensis]GIG83916.1 hypothetical protein Pka01_70430 [Planotetraspora kaengkrachanensis]